MAKRSENRHKVEIDYEYEQRRKLRALIGQYHGRLLYAAESLSHRMDNLYANHEKGWLVRQGEDVPPGYYLLSTVYRFLSMSALVRQLESEALLLDPKIAEKQDFTFLSYVAALHWVMTDVALFEGLSYDSYRERDHFFSDHFRRYSESFIRDGRMLSYEEFSNGPSAGQQLEPVLRFFSGLSRLEERYRWDRLVAMHLVLMSFLNTFGYKRQRCKAESFAHAASMAKNKRVLNNLVDWLPNHDLARVKEVRRMVKAIGPYLENA
ncbi:hypothetical protein BLA34_12675 [Ralstonia solanacearum]|nr:hypothetical protein BLA34_12675 [Ralstonia solanacearum]